MNRIVKNTIIVLLVALAFFGSVRATTSQVPLPWYLKVSPDPHIVYTGVPQCWATFTVSITGSSDVNIRIVFDQAPLSSGNLYYDETLSTVGRKAPFQFDVVVEGFPGLTTTYSLEVSAHADFPNNKNWFDYSQGGLNQKTTVTIITPSQYPPGGYCAHYTYTLATTHATMTYTTIDMTPRTTTYATHTWTYGTTTYDWRDWWWNWNWWAQWWPWEGEFDFSLDTTPTSQSMKAGGSVSFTVAVKLISGFAQPVTLSLSGLPSGMSPSFSLPSADPTFTSSLQVSSQESVSPGTYTLTIIGTGGGKTHSTSVSLITAKNMQQSSLSLSVSPSSSEVGESVALGGALAPGSTTTIEIVYTRPDGFELTKHVATSNTGAFSDAFAPDLPGVWSVRARWPGDANHYASESQAASFSVTGAAEKPPQPFLERIPPVLVLAAILAVIIVAAVLLRRRTSEKRTQPAATAIFCVKCGKAIPEGSGFCTNCGEKLR